MSPLTAAQEAMLRPWAWGEADCCTSACAAFAALHGVDPMAPLRGAYRTQNGARDEIAARGGWEAMTLALARDAGLASVAVEDAAAGDIGLMIHGATATPALALCVGSTWAVKTLRGMGLAQRADVVMAWRAPS